MDTRENPSVCEEGIFNCLCLSFQFEESYNALQTAFQLFDYMSDGYISRVDFRRCLQEFGFSVKMTEIDNFLTRYLSE